MSVDDILKHPVQPAIPQYPVKDGDAELGEFLDAVLSGKTKLQFQGDIKSDAVLPVNSWHGTGTVLRWREGFWVMSPNHVWVLLEERWEQHIFPAATKAAGESIKVLGSWPHDQEMPHAEDYKLWDAWYYRGKLWVRTPLFTWVESLNMNSDVSIPSPVPSPVEADPYPHHHMENDELNRLLEMATVPSDTDKGSMARELMEQKAEVKRLRIARIKYRCFFWGMILLIVTAAVLSIYGYVQRDLKTGRYSDFRECRIMVGDLAITGKRTYSYPFKSLWGNRWVDESQVEEVTTINLPGSKLAIVIDAEPKWIGYRFTDGERGTQILKAGSKYTFVTDKGMAMASYGGFCQAVDKQQSLRDDPKNPERTIVN